MEPDDYPFNDEFMLNEKDRAEARKRYEKIYPALDYPELRAVFMPLDDQANTAKRRSRRLGFAAVFFVAAALCMAPAEMLFGLPRPITLAAAAAFSVIGAALGAFGLLFAKTKKEWLENRFLTERLRQFHFQLLILLAPDIVAAGTSGDWSEFLRKRDSHFGAFKQDVIAHREPLFSATVEDAEPEGWFMPYSEPSVPAGEVAGQLFDAYRRLRINRQTRFADYKLQTTRRLLSPFPRDQASWFGGIAMACVLGILLLHLLALFISQESPYGEMVILGAGVVAVAALAVRTLEEGLRPGREIERYRAYQSALRSIGRRFDEAETPSAKFKAMAALETLAYNEMVNFLKSNHEARFVM